MNLTLLLIAAFATEPSPESSYDFNSWARDRVGPVVFPEKSSWTWPDSISLASALGTRAVKTWLGAEQPGDAFRKLQSEPYCELVRRFQVVHFNISPGYILKDYKPGKIDGVMLTAVETEWRDIATWLCAHAAKADQVFLLSVGGELNVYVGTKGACPDFPVAAYVNACHRAKETALRNWKAPAPRIYTVAEVQGDKEFDRFAGQWVPQFETDLISLSYYTFYRPLEDSLAVLQRLVKPLGPFGAERLMLGEYGPALEVCNWNDAERVRWHDDILHAAFRARLQFAFFYELTDHELVIKTGFHDGLVPLHGPNKKRPLWDYYESLYKGQWKRPTKDFIVGTAQDLPEKPVVPLTVASVSATDSAVRPGQKVTLKAEILNKGADTPPGGLNFFVNGRLIGWACLPPMKSGEKVEIRSTANDARFVWIARKGTSRIEAVLSGARRMDGLYASGQSAAGEVRVKYTARSSTSNRPVGTVCIQEPLGLHDIGSTHHKPVSVAETSSVPKS